MNKTFFFILPLILLGVSFPIWESEGSTKNAVGVGISTIISKPPVVIQVSPVSNEAEVAINRKVITATFSKPMDSVTINDATFIISGGVAGSVTYDPISNSAAFIPSGDLASNTTYFVTITTGTRDAAGNPMESDYVWGFTTGSVRDITPPAVISTSPTVNETGVANNTVIKATFSEAMDPASIDSSTFTLSGGISGTVTYDRDSRTATFTPSSDLEYEKITYTATISSAVKDAAGNNMATDYIWSFTTGEYGVGCFIATAAYGSYLDPHVQVLREFRDEYLLTNMPGRIFVWFYYSVSPPIADFIREREVLRTATRFALTPVVYGAKYPLRGLMVVSLGSGWAIYRRKKKTAQVI